MDHARLVARLLQDEFGAEAGLDNYAVPIISEEGEEGRRWLEDFADSDKRAPIVATTAELLSTGVDVPPCKNIVFMKTLSSPILFKQIIGRGSRLNPATDKYWFRIVDYTGATRLFDEWDRPPGPSPEPPQGPLTARLTGQVVHADSGDRIAGAVVSVRTGPNTQQGPIRTDRNGGFAFAGLPAGTLALLANARGFVRRELRVEIEADETVSVEVPLKPERQGGGKIRVQGLEVTIADEAVFLIEATGQQLTLDEYRDHTRRQVINTAPTPRTLRDIWVNPARRRAFLEDLRRSSIHPEVLAEVLSQTEADTFDVLSNLAFGTLIHTRSERAAAFANREQGFLQEYDDAARQVILELLEKYRVGGIDQLRSEIFRISPFREWGGAVTISRRFGGVEALGATLTEMQRRIYPETEVA
jgi:type I restriction enzyme R subunit